MKRTLKKGLIAWVVGLALCAVGILIWAYPMPAMFPFGQTTVAAIIIFIGVMTMIFGDPPVK